MITHRKSIWDISASKKTGMPFDFSRYHINPQDYHMEPDQLQHVCKQILWVNVPTIYFHINKLQTIDNRVTKS